MKNLTAKEFINISGEVNVCAVLAMEDVSDVFYIAHKEYLIKSELMRVDVACKDIE